ncbi:hypothetical protein [Flavobacterium anhuiense]|mgnify:FL=1|uniref:hypothetical protein n=1 Tax=Flavobacterium anhuiense TaxID=459526 RepID=UPI003D96C81A
MAIQTLDTIKNWFRTGLKPTQAQFWDTWQSFWHKNEEIPQSSIANLINSLDNKENKNNKSLTLSSSSTNDDYPSSKAVYDFVNEFVKSENNLNTGEIVDLVQTNSLIPGNYYLINDFQTIYTINGSDSSPAITTKRIDSFISNSAALNGGYDLNLTLGKSVVITKLPEGYSGPITVGSTTTVSVVDQGYYFCFANGMESILGLEFQYTMPRYSNGIADNIVVNDVNGKPIIRPGGVLNIEVHNNTPYMNMSGSENLGVPLESIILKAKSTNEFELEGKSVTYPDDIIEYRLPVEGNVATKGTILRRYNNALNIDLRIDWRVQRYRRWKISADSILKVLNQDQAVTTLTGFANTYQFTATNSTKLTPERFYIAYDLDCKSLAIDANTKIIDFTLEVSSYLHAKDFTIFKLDQNHQPVDIKMMKVSGSFENSVIQNNLGDLNFDTNLDMQELSNTTFVCSAVCNGAFVKISDSLFMDSLFMSPDSKAGLSISKTKSLPFLIIGDTSSAEISNCVIGINSNNYGGNPVPPVRWIRIESIQSSILDKVLLGGSTPNYNFNNSEISNSTLFFYYNQRNEDSLWYTKNTKLSFNNCLMLSMSIFNRSKIGNVAFNDVVSNVFYTPSSASKRDVYVNSTDLTEIKIQMNKYNHKLFYEERNASDVATITTYATPLA